MKRDTQAVRIQAERSPAAEHAVPVYLSSGYLFASGAEAAATFAGESDHRIYGRVDNPNTDELCARIAALEGTDAAIATATGMSAMFTAMMGLLRSGDHIVAAWQVFGSTLGLFREFLPRFGIETTLVDMTDTAAWEAACTPRTRLLVAETPSNPGLEVADIAALAGIAHAHGARLLIDNCFATPTIQRPVEHGADVVVHSATKFIDGQGRVLGGLIAADADTIATIRPFFNASGPAMAPFNAWLLSRSLETLSVRMEKHAASAGELARRAAAAGWPVRYPGADDFPARELVRRQMSNGGALFTVDYGTTAAAMAAVDALEIVSRSVNLGDSRTIATHPATTTHSGLPEELRARLGITPGLVRYSIGLEDPEDLWDDLERAGGAARAATGADR